MSSWLDRLGPLAPPVRTVQSYRRADLPHDLVAGLTVAVVDLPQSMAFAIIAGVPPVYGLYTAMVLAALGALFTSSRFLAVGPTNTQSLLVASIVSRVWQPHDMHYVYLVVALTLLKGLIQLAFAAARMGRLVRYISQSVMVGFAAGAGVLILVEQTPSLLGFAVDHAQHGVPGVVGAVSRWLPHLHEIDWRSLALGAAALVLILGLRVSWRRVPGHLLAVVGAAAAVWALGWNRPQAGVRLVGALPRRMPGLVVPRIGFGRGPQRIAWTEVEALLGGALALAVLGMLESVSIAKSIAVRTGQRISANQEFFGQGFANVVGSLFLCMPGSGSFSRTALQYAVGARTRLASVFCAAFVAVFFMILAPLARLIPLAALAAVLFVVAVTLIDARALLRLWRANRGDFVVAAVTFVAALVVPLAYAIYVGIFLSLALYLRTAGRLRASELVPTPEGVFLEYPLDETSIESDVLFVQLEGDLFFGVADALAERLAGIARSPARVVVLRLKRTHDIDATVLATLERFVREMHERHRRDDNVVLCGVRAELMARLRGYGLVELVGPANIFETTRGVFEGARAALAHAHELAHRDPPGAPDGQPQ